MTESAKTSCSYGQESGETGTTLGFSPVCTTYSREEEEEESEDWCSKASDVGGNRSHPPPPFPWHRRRRQPCNPRASRFPSTSKGQAVSVEGKKASSFALHKRSVAILRPLPPSKRKGAEKSKGGWESEGGKKGPRRDWPDASAPFIIIEARHLFFLPRFPPHTSRLPFPLSHRRRRSICVSERRGGRKAVKGDGET